MPSNRGNDGFYYDGINRHFTSFSGYNLTSTHLNKAVTHTASKTVGLGSDGNDLAGKLMIVDEDLVAVTVQDQGYVVLPYSGVTPAVGDRVVVDGVGGVRTTAVGHSGGRPKVIDTSTFSVDGNVTILQE